MSKIETWLFQLALNPLVPVQLLRTDAPVSSGATRKGEGKVNSLIGMSAIPHTYLTPKPWELQPKSDTFLGRENSHAVKSNICCQLQDFISIFWLWVSQSFSSTALSRLVLLPLFQLRGSVLWSHTLVRPYWCLPYKMSPPWLIKETRNRSWVSSRFATESQCCVNELHLQGLLSAWCYLSEINRCLCCTVTLSRASACSSISPESNPFHRSHKVFLTFKIHSTEFIHWSEVARAPKTNRGLRSGISNGHVPSTHHAGLIQ